MPAQIVWHSPSMLPLVAALAVALVVAVFWLYPVQVRSVRRPWRWILPGLRATALLALAASLLQPAVRRLRSDAERGTVLVLLDRSRSMSVTDVDRSPAELVAIADGLGRLPDGVRSSDAGQLSVGLEHLRGKVAEIVAASNDLETAEAFGRGVDAAGARLASARASFQQAADALASRASGITTSESTRAHFTALRTIPPGAPRKTWPAEASRRIDAADADVRTLQSEIDRKLYESDPSVKSACDDVARLSRWSLAQEALLSPTGGLAARLGTTFPINIQTLSESPSTASPPLALQDVKAGRLPDSPNGAGSDITGAVTAALSGATSGGGREVRAVVLISDGRQVGGGDAAIVAGVSPAGVPVFAVGVAPPARRPADLAFSRETSVSRSAFVGETIAVRAGVVAAGLPAGAVDVQLRAGEVVQSQRVELQSAGAAAAPVEFFIRLEHAGPQRIVLSLPPMPGEITTENNLVERWVKVLPERTKVSLFAGDAGRDVQLLRGVLARTPWIRLDHFGVTAAAKPTLSLTPDQILRQDVLILSDVAAGALSDVQWDAVNRLVREHGGSLFLIAGPDNLPSTYTPSTIVPSALLPYDPKNVTPNWRTWPGEQAAFRFQPASQISPEQSEALKLGPGPGSLRQWQSLGGAFRFMPVPELNPRSGAHALLVDADSHLPVLTESFAGSGRVLFLGTNETWRWQQKTGARDFDRFWLQLVRYAAGEPYAAERESLALDADQVAAAPGERVQIRARILSGEPDAFRVDLLRGGAVVQSQKLTPSAPPGSGRFTTAVSAPEESEYTLRLSNPGDDNPAALSLEIPLHVATSAETEMADVAGDDALLRRIADATGGELLSLDRLRELPRLLSGTHTDSRSRFAQWRLWDSPLLFVFVVACFGAEWALRKYVGLA